MKGNLLIMFIRNSISGKVKTRLAKSIGDDKALEVYIRMLEYIRVVTGKVPYDKAIYYSEFIETNDIFQSGNYDKYLQSGADQGEKLHNAFSHAFSSGYERVIMICSDCFDLTHSHIVDAFESLHDADTIIGPNTDGGYYLLGMNQFFPVLFYDKVWDGENVFLDTLIDFKKNDISFRLLETLDDIENFEDVRRTGEFPDIADNSN